MTKSIDQARKLENVRYDIRGRILDKTEELEDQGHTILRLNVGNPAPFGFEAPDEIMMAMIRNLPTAQGYSRFSRDCSRRARRWSSTTRRGVSPTSPSTRSISETGYPN